jgi:hypothetical protein
VGLEGEKDTEQTCLIKPGRQSTCPLIRGPTLFLLFIAIAGIVSWCYYFPAWQLRCSTISLISIPAKSMASHSHSLLVTLFRLARASISSLGCKLFRRAPCAGGTLPASLRRPNRPAPRHLHLTLVSCLTCRQFKRSNVRKTHTHTHTYTYTRTGPNIFLKNEMLLAKTNNNSLYIQKYNSRYGPFYNFIVRHRDPNITLVCQV